MTASARRAAPVLVTLAALMIVIAGLRAAESVLVPFLLSVFISTVAATPLGWLRRRGVPTPIALVTVIAMILVGGTLLTVLISTSVREFTSAIPSYEQRLRVLFEQGVLMLQDRGIEVSREIVLGQFDPGFAMRMVGRTMSGLGSVLSNTFLILLTTIFILLEAGSFPRKLRAVLPDPAASMPRFRSFAETMNRYMAIKTTISVFTGLVIYSLNRVLGVDFPILWGVLAFLLNYVPNIGSLIASVPAVLLAAVQLGVGEAAFLGVAYFAVNTILGGMIEPRFMGRGLGLSTLVVWLSLVFWGWALGPVGMLLSVPLTVTLRIALESRAETHWIATLLGPGDDVPEPVPATGARGEEPDPPAAQDEAPAGGR